MKNTFFNYIKITLALVLFLQVGEVSGQNNLTMKSYGTLGLSIDGSVLDQVFGTVTMNGSAMSSDLAVGTSFTNIPTTVAGFGGVQVVYLQDLGMSMTSAQADALIAYVKAGGILIGNLEGTLVTPNNVYALKYIGEALLCNTITLSASASNLPGISPTPAYHPTNGALLLNSSSTTSVTNTSSYATVTGLPSENIIFANSSTASCTNVQALDFVIPAYPGSISSCGVNGFALLSGEVQGILTSSVYRNDLQINKNYTQLIYDYLYDATAMATRRAWSTITANKNTTCPPAISPAACAAGATAPTLSATTINNSTCATPYVNLNGLVTSTLPTGASLVWYTNSTRTGNPVLDPTKVAASGTYYAFFYDATNICYSPASAAVTATYTVCPLAITTTCPTASVDLASRVADDAPTDYTYTYHSGTPATATNKLGSSVVTTSGTYYVGTFSTAQSCYTSTSRPIAVTITNCCANVAPAGVN